MLPVSFEGHDWISLKVPFRPAGDPDREALRAQAKSLPGIRWTGKCWEGPFEAVGILVETLERAEVFRQGSLQELNKHLGSKCVVPHEPTAFSFKSRDGKAPYEYQKDAMRFLMNEGQSLGAALLGDEMGLGKTASCARAIQEELHFRGGSALVLCPAVVQKTWERELLNWTALPSVRLGAKKKKKEGGGRVLSWPEGSVGISSFDTFRGLEPETLARVVVVDELHYAANPKAARSKVLRGYVNAAREAFGNKFVVYGLTGTPINSSTKDLWNPLDILYPGRFGKQFSYETRYCDGAWVDVGLDEPVWQAKGKSNLEELGRRVQPLMLRRTKGEVLELPERQRILFPVEMPESVQKRLKTSMRGTAFNSERIGRLLSHVEDYKLDAAKELAEELLRGGKKVLLLTLRKESAKQLAESLKTVAVDGEVLSDRRADILNRAAEGRGCGVATIYSVTTGITLTSFDTIVFVGLDWIPSTLLQAEARIHRIGQRLNVTYYYMVGTYTADEIVQERVISRLDTFGTVVGNASEEKALKGTLSGGETEEELLASLLDDVRSMYDD